MVALCLFSACSDDLVQKRPSGSPDSSHQDAEIGLSDTSDVMADAPSPNACGGQGVLHFNSAAANTGDPCGPCGDGHLSCDGLDDLQCTAASIEPCAQELCGGVECQPEEVCYDGNCFVSCSDDGECTPPSVCFNSMCVEDPCAVTSCDPNQACYDGSCFDTCNDDGDCTPPSICFNDKCVEDPCVVTSCDPTQACYVGSCFDTCNDDGDCTPPSICFNAMCVDDPCVVTSCDPTQACYVGSCFDTCNDDGDCTPPLVCYNNMCVGGDIICLDVQCPPGSTCVAGDCVLDDPCDSITCKEGKICRDGACFDECLETGCPDGSTCQPEGCVKDELLPPARFICETVGTVLVLDWEPSQTSDELIAYRVYEVVDGLPTVVLDEVDPTQTSYVISEVVDASVYYLVTAVYAVGTDEVESEPSNVGGCLPTEPSNLAVEVGDQGAALVFDNDSGPGIFFTYYAVYAAGRFDELGPQTKFSVLSVVCEADALQCGLRLEGLLPDTYYTAFVVTQNDVGTSSEPPVTGSYVEFLTTKGNVSQANHWFFGSRIGLDFSTGQPVAVTSAMVTSGGTAVMSGPDGKLLFYTNGGPPGNPAAIFGDDDAVMWPIVSGCSESLQAAIAIPLLGLDDHYVAFTTDCEANSFVNGSHYYVVAFEKEDGVGFNQQSVSGSVSDSGRGSVIDSGLVGLDFGGALAAVRHVNGEGYWIIMYSNRFSTFHTFLVSGSSFDQGRLVLEPGPDSTFDLGSTGHAAMIRLSPNKLRLALALNDNGYLFNFDPSTGIVSEPVELRMEIGAVEFSHDCKYLYVTRAEDGAKTGFKDLVRFNLLVWPLDAQDFGRTEAAGFGAMQRAPDGNIYVARDSADGYLGAITSVGKDREVFLDHGLHVEGYNGEPGLPNFPSDMVGVCKTK